MRKLGSGKIIIPAGVAPWPHELRSAEILAAAGYVVEFLPKVTIKRADILLDGSEFEMKSPITNNPKKIVRNVKRALEQAQNVIIDSSRIEGMRDDALRRLLENRAKDQKRLRRLLFITKKGRIIDIKPNI